MSRTRALLAASLVLNLLGVAGVGLYLVRDELGLRAPAMTDYGEQAEIRFGDLPGSRVVVLGDSHVQDGPFGELIGASSRRGIGGARIFDVSAMVPASVTPEAEQVVVIAGTNDVLSGTGASYVRSDAQALVVSIRQVAPGAEVSWMAVPGPVGHAAETATVNAAIEQASVDSDFEFFTTDVTGADGTIRPEFTTDGTHLNSAGYSSLREELRAALGQTTG